MLQRRRLVPANMLVTQAVAAQCDNGREGDSEALSCGWDTRKKPGNMACMCEGEDEFVDYPVDADGARDEGERGIGGVAEDEVVRVKGCETVFADSTTVMGRVSY